MLNSPNPTVYLMEAYLAFTLSWKRAYIIFLFCHVTSSDHIFIGLHDYMGGSPSR